MAHNHVLPIKTEIHFKLHKTFFKRSLAFSLQMLAVSEKITSYYEPCWYWMTRCVGWDTEAKWNKPVKAAITSSKLLMHAFS